MGSSKKRRKRHTQPEGKRLISPANKALQEKIDKAWSIASTIVIGLLLIFVVFFKVLFVQGDSMRPTYYDGELLIGTRVWSAAALLNKNFPVCIVKPYDNLYVIKRLIGRPGDVVELRNGDTYVNDELVMRRNTNSWDNATYELGEDDWFFLGDNRAASIDGRYWPGHFVRLSQVKFVVPGSEL